MARRKKQAEPLPTIWRVDDELWAKAENVLEEFDPPARFGPDRIDQRKALDGVIYRMRSGVQWNHLPKEYGDDATAERAAECLHEVAAERELLPRRLQGREDEHDDQEVARGRGERVHLTAQLGASALRHHRRDDHRHPPAQWRLVLGVSGELALAKRHLGPAAAARRALDADQRDARLVARSLICRRRPNRPRRRSIGN